MQKQEFLTHPELFPEAYRSRIIGILSSFDNTAANRTNAVKRQLKKAHIHFEQTLQDSDVSDEDKNRLLARAKAQVDNLFPGDTLTAG